MKLVELYRAANLTADEIVTTAGYLNSDDGCFMNTSAYEKLFEHLYWKTGEMPYEVAKARTKCPDTWILEHLEWLS